MGGKAPGARLAFSGGHGFAPGVRGRLSIRMVIEPAALLEPTFKAGPAALRELADQQVYLLKGGIRLSRTELFSMNSQFHEVLIGFPITRSFWTR